MYSAVLLYFTNTWYVGMYIDINSTSTWYTLWRVGITWIQWQRGGTRDGADRVDGLHEWSTHKYEYLDWLHGVSFPSY